MNEKTRTILLLALLVLGLGFIYWVQNSYEQNFTETLGSFLSI